MDMAFSSAAVALEDLFAEIRSKPEEAPEQEPWLLALLATQLGLLVTVVIFRRHTGFTAAVFALSAGLVYNLERLNALGARHWQKFAGQPYFDEYGIFLGAVVAAPLLLLMFVLLAVFLFQTSQLLIRLKRQELRAKARRRAGAESKRVS